MTPTVALQVQGLAVDPTLVQRVGQLLAFVITAAVVSGAVALVFRWYTRDPVPLGVATMLGLSAVALYLNTVGLFTQLVGGASGAVFELEAVVFNVVALVLSVLVTPVSRSIGDRVATDVFAVAGAPALDAEVSRIVRTVGRVTAVTLPEADDIDDMESYDPVAAELKEEMGGKTLLFPNRLTTEELHDRLVTRLKDDYRVGYVDIELAQDGSIDYLAVGSRAAGLGPTLGHGTVAVAVRADPPHGATAGDVVQVWRTGAADDHDATESLVGSADATEDESNAVDAAATSPERLFTAELRAQSGDVVTLAVDATDVEMVDEATSYRLVSLPAEPQADREFASLLRAADETMATVTVTAASEVVGTTLGSLDVTVAAVRPASGPVEAIPTRAREIEAGDTLYVVARPEVLRRLEAQTNVVVDAPPGVGRETELSAD